VSPGGTARAAGRRPVSGPRPKLTGRAAVLAIVLCAIALTLAYPIREYIADHRLIDQLAAQNAQMAAQVKHQRAELRALGSPTRIEQEARDNLHMCFPSETCYEVIYPAKPQASAGSQRHATPWYGRLWKSVAAADAPAAR
jgi:cell division protein FtsB